MHESDGISREAGEEVSAFDSLYMISSLVWQAQDSKEALGMILDEVMEAFEAATASISLVNFETQRLEIEAARGFPDESMGLQLPLGQGLTGWVALHGEPILCKDVLQEPRYFPAKGTIRSELAVPMLDAGRVIGVVSVDSETEGSFSEKDLKLLTLLAGEATRAVTRFWHMQLLQTQAQQMQALIQAGEGLVAQRREDAIWEGVLGRPAGSQNVRSR